MPLSLKLEIDWDGDGSFTHAASDVSADIVGETVCSRGRVYSGAGIAPKSAAGVLRTHLRNDDGRYDALSAGSAIGTLLTSQRKVRLSAAYAAEMVAETVLWTGFLDEIDPVRRGPLELVSLRALGIISLMALARPLVEGGEAEEVGEAMARVVRAVEADADVDLLASEREIARWWRLPGESALDMLRGLEDSGLGFLYEAADGRLGVEDSSARSGAGKSVLHIADDGSGDVGATFASAAIRNESIANRIRVRLRRQGAGSAGVLWTGPATIATPAEGSLKLIARYPAPDSPPDHIGVSEWTALAAGTDYTAPAGVTVTHAAKGDDLEITLANTNSVDADVTGLQARGTPLVEADPVVVELADDESIDDYGERAVDYERLWIATVEQANGLGRLVLNLHKDPLSITTVEYLAIEAPAVAVGVALTDRVTTTVRGSSGQAFVENIQHIFRPGGVHRVRLVTSPTNAVITGSAVIVLDSGPGLDSGSFAF